MTWKIEERFRNWGKEKHPDEFTQWVVEERLNDDLRKLFLKDLRNPPSAEAGSSPSDPPPLTRKKKPLTKGRKSANMSLERTKKD